MDLRDAILDSWHRQTQIVRAVASRVTETTRQAKPSPDGWPLDHQLAHMHQVRKGWIANIRPDVAGELGDAFTDGWTTPIEDLDEIKRLLDQSGTAVARAFTECLDGGIGKVGGYDHPMLFLQHMVWHDGWHVGLIMLGLRLAGEEPSEEWEETNVWGHWRTEEWD